MSGNQQSSTGAQQLLGSWRQREPGEPGGEEHKATTDGGSAAANTGNSSLPISARFATSSTSPLSTPGATISHTGTAATGTYNLGATPSGSSRDNGKQPAFTSSQPQKNPPPILIPPRTSSAKTNTAQASSSASSSRRAAAPGWSSSSPDSTPGLSVPSFDKRGYRKQGSPTSSSAISPRSSRTPSTRPTSSGSDEPIHGASETITTPRVQFNHTATPTSPAAVGNRFYVEDKDTESADSAHFITALYDRGTTPEDGSICSSESWDQKGSPAHNDFGVDPKTHRRKVVSMMADPHAWAYLGPEDDDDIHNPEIKTKQTGVFGSLLTLRGFANMGCLAVLVIGLVVLFAGYPIIVAALTKQQSTFGAFNVGGINASGQLPDVGPFQLIDRDTPQDAYFHTSLETGDQWELVFSDEFNRDGRTFYPGDDPYWQAEDYHYWQTTNLNWYDPRQLSTKEGHLEVRLDRRESHNLNYSGGLMTTWNRFCFTGGYLVANVSLPGRSDVYGLWPAIWTLGNLGRAGYGGSLDGMWPYTYDACDVGTVKNQSIKGVPRFTRADGDKYNDYDFSYLPGQRLSRCTCQESKSMHPGPIHPDGTLVGRGAPEIDIFEAAVGSNDASGIDTGVFTGHNSMSAQWAPFNPGYRWINTSATYEIYDDSVAWINDYQGGVYQQATSALVMNDQSCYTNQTGCYSVYGFEYAPGYDGYVTWVNDGKKAWSIRGGAMGPNERADISGRPVPQEPMYIIINLGISPAFGGIDYEGLDPLWPFVMNVDWIRVYQDPKKRNIGCDPPDFPTAAYIAQFPAAYNNANLTTYDDVIAAGAEGEFHWPKNSLLDSCT